MGNWNFLFHCAEEDKGFHSSSAMLSNTQGCRSKDTLHVQHRPLNAYGAVVRDAASVEVNEQCNGTYFNDKFVSLKKGVTGCKNVRVKGFSSTPKVYSTMKKSGADMQTTGAVVFMIKHTPCERPDKKAFYVLMLAEDCPLSCLLF